MKKNKIRNLNFEIKEAMNYCKKNNLEFIYENFNHFFADNLNLKIKEESEIHILLESDFDYFERSYTIREVLDLIQDIKNIQVNEEQCSFRSETMAFFMILESDLLYEIEDILDKNLFFTSVELDGEIIDIDITLAYDVLELKGIQKELKIQNLQNKFFIELYGDIEKIGDRLESIVESYLFEINSIYELELSIKRRKEKKKKVPKEIERKKIKPLLLDSNLIEIINIFNRVHEFADYNISFLYYSQVIEYASITAVKDKKIEEILHNVQESEKEIYQKVLNKIYEDIAKKEKDDSALRITIEKCCNISVLKERTPEFLIKFKLMENNDSDKIIKEAFKELSSAITATRNKIVHAKSNYQNKGFECPEDQMSDFVNCLRIIAEQIIYWYASH